MISSIDFSSYGSNQASALVSLGGAFRSATPFRAALKDGAKTRLWRGKTSSYFYRVDQWHQNIKMLEEQQLMTRRDAFICVTCFPLVLELRSLPNF